MLPNQPNTSSKLNSKLSAMLASGIEMSGQKTHKETGSPTEKQKTHKETGAPATKQKTHKETGN